MPPQTPFPSRPNAAAGRHRFAASAGPSGVNASPASTASSSATPLWTRSACEARTTAGGPSVGKASVHAAYTVEPDATATTPPVGTPRAEEKSSLPQPVSRQEIAPGRNVSTRSEEHTSELQSRGHLVCRLLL